MKYACCQCRLCPAFWRFRLFICFDKLSSPPGHCFFESEYLHARAGDPLYCVRKAAARSLHYASISSALVFTKKFFRNILDIIRRVFFLFSFNVHCLVSLNMHCWFVSFPAFFFLMLLEGQKFSSSLHPPDQMGSRQHSMRLILIFVSGPLFGAHATKLEVPGSIPCRVLENFQATSSSLSAFSNPGVHSIPNRSDFQEMFLR